MSRARRRRRCFSTAVIGFDYHEDSIAHGGCRAHGAGLSDRLRFELARADGFPGTGYDLVTSVDCLHDMGRPYYAFSTLLCTPNALSQGGELAPDAHAGGARLRTALTAGGFTRVRRTAETPLNPVLEARP